MPSEVAMLFEKKLHLSTVGVALRNKFLLVMSKYLEHGRTEGVVEGRTYDYLEKHLNELVILMEAIGLSNEEKVIVITNMPSLLNTSSDMITKYLLLGVLENEDNTFRKNKLINKTNDFRIGLRKLYARYVLATHAGYPEINWNLLVHSSDLEFAKRFVRGSYYKPYQMFRNIDEVMAYLDRIDVSQMEIDEIISWDVNRELVENYGERKRKM
jgi:hypothetical protein